MNSAKRGKEWENIIDPSFAIIDNCTVTNMGAPVNVIRFTNRVKGLFTGCFTGKGSCDYEGGYQGSVVSIEAKRTKQLTWSFASIKPHQLARMRSTVNMGGIAGVLLWWDHKDGSAAYFGISFQAIQRWIRAGKKSVNPRDLMAGCDVDGFGVKRLVMRPAQHNGKFSTVCNLVPTLDMMIGNTIMEEDDA